MKSEHWKSSFTLDGVTLHLVGFKGESKAVFRVENTDRYYCFTYNEITGVTKNRESVTWEQASEFLK